MAIDLQGTAFVENTNPEMPAGQDRPFALSMWVNCHSLGTTTQYGFMQFPGSQGYTFAQRNSKVRILTKVTDGGGPDVSNWLQTDAVVPENEWHHYFVQWSYNSDFDETEMRFYLDNVMQAYVHHWDAAETIVYPGFAGNQKLEFGQTFFGYMDCSVASFAMWIAEGPGTGLVSAAQRAFIYESRLLDAPILLRENWTHPEQFYRLDEANLGAAISGISFHNANIGPGGDEGQSPFVYGGGSGGIGDAAPLVRWGGCDVVEMGPWPRTVALNAASLASAAPNVAIVPGSVNVLMDAAALAASTGAVSILPGAVTVGVESASLEAAAAAITIRGGLIVLPDGRGIKVAIEDRMILVSMEDRLIGVPSEDKIVAATSEDRVTSMPDEDRIVRTKQ